MSDTKEKTGWFARLKKGLKKTQVNLVGIFTGGVVDEAFLEELEFQLIASDVGVEASAKILDSLRDRIKLKGLKTQDEVKVALKEIIAELLKPCEASLDFDAHNPLVIMMCGVNGAGKTTTIGKLAKHFSLMNKRVLLAAADTFRAAAGEQLKEWANRAQVDMIGGQEGADPAAVVFDAVAAAKARHVDLLLCDTAGRLHNKKNLMEELKKINRVIEREYPEAHRETLVVLDATTGQNALSQAREFNEVADITGVILTKMDGTAKGGIAVAIHAELGIPVKYIGVGESIDDLQKFDADSFVEALFTVEEKKTDTEEI